MDAVLDALHAFGDDTGTDIPTMPGDTIERRPPAATEGPTTLSESAASRVAPENRARRSLWTNSRTASVLVGSEAIRAL